MAPQTLGILLAVTTGLFWAWLAIVLKYALQFSSAPSIVWIRMLFSAITLALYLKFFKPKSFTRVRTKLNPTAIIAGLFLTFNYYAYMRGIEFTSASNAQIMIQLGPLALLLSGIIFFGERLRFSQWLGVFIAGLGFVLFNLDQVQITMDNASIYLTGNVWIIFAAITWAIYAVMQKKLIIGGWTPQEINLIIYIVATLCLTPFIHVEDFINKSLWQWFIYYLLAFNTLIAYGAFAEALALIPSSQVSVIITANPLLTILFMELIAYFGGTFVSPEPIHLTGYLGALLVVIGIALAVGLKQKLKPHKTSAL